MTIPRGFRQEAGFTTAPVIAALTGVLALTIGATAWIALHPPGHTATRALNLPSVPGATPLQGQKTPAESVPKGVLDDNARMRLRYGWLVASDFARDHRESYTGLSPRIARRLLLSSGVDVMLRGEGRVVLTRFDTSRTAAAGVVSIRVANGNDLLLVTRSRTGTVFCFVQRGRETGIGAGDVDRVAKCVIRWG